MAGVRYPFTASGWESVVAAFRSVEAAANESAAAASRAKRAFQGRGIKGAPVGATAARKEGDAEIAVVRETGRRRASAEEAAQRHVAAIRDRYFMQEQRRQERLDALAAKRSQATIAMGKQRAREMAGVVKSVVGSGVALSVGAIGAATREAFKLSEIATRISINSRLSGKAAADPNALRKSFESTAMRTPGVSALDVAEGTKAFVTKTGRLDKATQFQDTFATVASATGSSVEKIASASAELFQKMDITSVSEMRDALAALTVQGKEGAFELDAAAEKFAKMGSAASRFGIDKGVKGVRTLGGLSQIAMEATGDKDVAATAVEATLRQLVAQSGNLKSDGVRVFDKSGKTRDLQQLLPEVIAQVGGLDMEKKAVKLQKRFGDEGIRALSPLITAFQTGVAGATGKGGKPASDAEKMAAGIEAVTRKLDGAINATGSWTDIQKDAAMAQSTASAQLSAAWERLKSTASEEVVPALVDIVPKLMPFAKAVGSAAVALGSFVKAINVILDLMPGLRVGGGDAGERAKTLEGDIAATEEAAKKKVEQAQGQIGTLETLAKTRKLTPNEQKQLDAAKSAVASGGMSAEESTALAESKKSFESASREAKFTEDFIAANTSSLKTRKDLEIDAANFYEAVQKDPIAARAQADAIAKTTGGAPVPFLTTANQAQADIVGSLAGDVTAERLQASGGKSGTTQTAGGINVDAMQPALNALVEAFKKAATEVANTTTGNRATTVTPTG